MQPPAQPPASRSNRRRRWIRFVFAATLVAVTTAVLVHVFTRETPLHRLKQQIRNEVPLGSTREQVEAWAKQTLGTIPGETGAPPKWYFGAASTIPEAAGVPRSDLGSALYVVVPSVGWYITPYGEVAQNNLFVYFTLNEEGQVTGHYFLTLEELAAVEQKRLRARSR